MEKVTISDMLEVSENELQEYTPLLRGWSAFVFVITIIIVCVITRGGTGPARPVGPVRPEGFLAGFLGLRA